MVVVATIIGLVSGRNKKSLQVIKQYSSDSKMASNRVEASRRVVEETRRLYASLLSRPLSDTQLLRPTFKYIQEIVKSLITETRILRNVFNPIDFDTEKRVWDKRMKVDFVQRLIDFAANHKQPVVGCLAAKVVAGLEPNKSNELLQALARIAHARLSGQGAAASGRPRTFTKPTGPVPIAPNAGRLDGQKSSGGGHADSQRTRVAGTGGGVAGRTPATLATGGKQAKIESQRTGTNSVAQVLAEHQLAFADNKHDTRPPPEATASGSPPAITSRTATIQPQQQVLSTPSESDINKNLQHLRSHLKSLRSTLNDVGQMEDSLRSKLSSLMSANESAN